MASHLRREKLSMLFREQLAAIIDREIDFPYGNMITVTRVEISDDNHYANVFISLLGKDALEILDLLKKNVYHIQQILNRRVRMRPVPKIRFTFDREEFNRAKVEKKLAELKQTKEL